MSFDLPGVKPNSDIETLFKTVGFIVVQWGQTEQNLDLMVAGLFGSFKGHPLFNRRPRNLEPKVKFLRDCFEQLPELAQFRAESDPLLSRFLTVGEKRNDIVHGGIADLSIKDGAFIFLKIDVVAKEHHSIRSVFLDDSDWPAFRKELMRLGKDVQSLSRRVRDSLKART
ncbi:MAG: hypothetical protein Q8J80_03225 [Gallionella sp.]|nr:hypothetical protein [Gallionella sp.]